MLQDTNLARIISSERLHNSEISEVACGGNYEIVCGGFK